MSQFLQNIFSSPLLIGRSDNIEICKKIEGLAEHFRETSSGRLVSEEWNKASRSSKKEDINKFGITSYDSLELLQETEWADIAAFVYDFANTMVQSANPVNTKMLFTNMWTNVYPPGAFIPEHTHSNSLLSGVFYAKAEKNCGNIHFRDPSYLVKTMFMRGTGKFPTLDTRYEVEVETGKMILFPSWMPHETKPNLSGEDRVIISFNMDFVDADTYEEPK